LDGTVLARSVVSEAIRIAGSNGELILIRDATGPLPGGLEGESPEVHAIEVSEAYLHGIAEPLRAGGLNVRVEAFFMVDPADAIDEAARLFDVDLIACATEARAGLQRLIHPSVAWRALSRSPVPVLLHRRSDAGAAASNRPVRMLVPLDGSSRAELAVPVAVRIAQETGGSIVLARVIANPVHSASPVGQEGSAPAFLPTDLAKAQAYLACAAAATAAEVETVVFTGRVVEELVAAVSRLEVTDFVLASHGRTGLARVILGSVADDLVHASEISVVVVPAMAANPHHRREPQIESARQREPSATR
jgi:nucleotide-binding universal stress UspA family protein